MVSLKDSQDQSRGSWIQIPIDNQHFFHTRLRAQPKEEIVFRRKHLCRMIVVLFKYQKPLQKGPDPAKKFLA